MKSKWLVWLGLAAAAALPGASTLSAQEYRREYREDRDLAHDYRNVERIRADMARDQYRLNEAIRCGRRGEAAAIERDLNRDRWELRAQRRDIRNDYRYGWR